MAYRYDARGNIYIVSSPQELQTDGVSIPDDARQAALTKGSWAGPAITHFCGWGHEGRPAGAKAHRSDGLLVGPFRIGQDADLLVVNTDGSLAKRSGNGLTIFAQALKDKNVGDPDAPRVLRVHHDQPGPTPTVTNVEPATVDGASGFWLDLGVPFFGPEEVGARSSTIGPAPPTSHGFYRVHRLADVDAAWERSVFVNVGNPHCVTFLERDIALPTMEQLGAAGLFDALAKIAFVQPSATNQAGLGYGDPCPSGINLQWASIASSGRVVARVFERGEGPTASSGTSATAVACAAWMVGLVQPGIVEIEMPGGVAPVRLEADGRELRRASLFGTAVRLAS